MLGIGTVSAKGVATQAVMRHTAVDGSKGPEFCAQHANSVHTGTYTAVVAQRQLRHKAITRHQQQQKAGPPSTQGWNVGRQLCVCVGGVLIHSCCTWVLGTQQ